MQKERIIVLGANGQIGTVLTAQLRKEYGKENVIATDIREAIEDLGPFVLLDVLNAEKLSELIDQYNITQIYHLAALLSASGEKDPKFTWNINVNAYLSVLEIALQK